MKKLFILLFTSLFIVVFSVKSQEILQQKTSLKKVFTELENTHNVKFSFSDNLIENRFILIDLKKKTLEEILIELQSKTLLVFQKVTKRYIIVSEKNDIQPNTICGYLYDKNNKFIEGATILNSTKIIGTTSNEFGYFQLTSIKEGDTLNISFLGYKSIRVSAKKLFKKPCSKIYLTESTSTLDEVLITNYLTGGISKKKDGSIVISSKKLEILPGLTEPDALQSIQLLPGIVSPNETASGIHIRGGTPDQNLILFDGIKMYNSAHFFGMISAFNPYTTHKITVFKNGVGTKYGNHISGVIDIETDNDLVDKTNGGFGFNLTHLDAFFNIKLTEKFSFSISARRSFTDALNTNTFNKLSEKVFQNTIIADNNNFNEVDFFTDTNFSFIDFNSKLIYEPNKKDKLIFNQLFINNKLKHNFGSIDNTYKTSDALDIENQGFSAIWIRKWNHKITQKSSFYHSNYSFNYGFTETTSTINQNQNAFKTNEIKDLNFKTSLEFKRSLMSNFNFGYQFSNNNVSYKLERKEESEPNFDYSLEESEKNITHAIFGEYIFNNDDNFILQTGIRGNYFSLTDKLFLAPRLYTQILLFPKFWVKGSIESKQQNISQLLEFTTSDFGLENQIWALSTSENIPILKSNQYTFGIIYKKDNWILDIDFYQKKITGLTSLSKGFQTINDDFSEGKSNIIGVDFLLQKRWTNYSSWFSYSFSNNQFTFSDINNGNSFSGNFDIKHNFLWSHNLKVGKYDFSLGWNFRTGIPYTNALGIDNNNQILYENKLNGSRLPSYHKLDFSSTYSFNFNYKWTGKVGISFLNIYNNKSILQRNFSVIIDENNNEIMSKNDVFSLGFTPNLVFRLFF